MKRAQVLSAEDLQVVDAGSEGVVQLGPSVKLRLALYSQAPFRVFIRSGPVSVCLGNEAQFSMEREFDGFEELVITAGEKSVAGWVFRAPRNFSEVLDPTPVKIVTPEEYERSLTVDQLIRRELARYHRARLDDDEQDPDDGLDFDEETDDLDGGDPYPDPPEPQQLDIEGAEGGVTAGVEPPNSSEPAVIPASDVKPAPSDPPPRS